ncbi:hypothetical protein [Paenibacillus sp. NFR01]|uniref:DUF7667 family protein n=1 Tax=Paenibacillus sp. NFR01 TaxID=1566279 RepID=UPI0008BAADD0|nr:hypothetical protein [Paenibacillus sp. NFR01]SEU32539.1 hypothetical protein SAMN03159358_0134 [Paenibacillus sp. NFR01]
MLAIHPIHRRLAEVVHMNLDQNGNLLIGNVELQMILKLLRENHDLVYKMDGLKELAFLAHEMCDMDWLMDLCAQIEALEAQMI